MHPRLEARRANNEPKCASCGWWAGLNTETPAAHCGLHNAMTLDLVVCSGWRDGDVIQTVLPPEKDE
jgi:hypothetical protein